MNSDVHCDVLVVGGGPAGSTMAALLAERGEQVVLVEKEKHPRFHIGESLLPFNLPLLEKLGVGDEVAAIGMPKFGAEFVSSYHNKTVEFKFANAWDKNFPGSYQVRRSDFDHILLKNAAAKGATVIEECRVTDVEFLPEGGAIATGQDNDGTARRWHAKFLVDASGRDTLLAKKFDVKHRNHKHNTAAMYGHFTGALRNCGPAEGNILLFWFDNGWFWFIPLSDGTTSVGAVCSPGYMKSRKTDITTFFHDTIASCPGLIERLKDAQLVSPVTATGNYSYRAGHMVGKSYMMLGDAYAFLDPLFSTGVYLAMNSAFEGVEAVSTCLHEPAKAKHALKKFDATIQHGIDAYSWYIYRAPMPALRNLLMVPRNTFRIEEAILSILAGDVFRRTPIGIRLLAFKAIYYLQSLGLAKASFMAWRQRRRNAQAVAGEAV
jgi:flavin-dependent dehydrogenase